MLVFKRKKCTPVFYLIEAAFLEPNLSILNKELYFFLICSALFMNTLCLNYVRSC